MFAFKELYPFTKCTVCEDGALFFAEIITLFRRFLNNNSYICSY